MLKKIEVGIESIPAPPKVTSRAFEFSVALAWEMSFSRTHGRVKCVGMIEDGDTD
jgi:hypothetical protein